MENIGIKDISVSLKGMDFQFWIWLIVIVITLIARANKKKAPAPPPEEDSVGPRRQSQPERPTKGVTFEDLLREIQGEKALSRTPEPKVEPSKPAKEYEITDYDDDIPDEIQDLEDVDYKYNRDEEVLKNYKEAQKQAKLIEKADKSAKVGKIVRSEHFKEYDLNKRKKPTFDFIEELKDPKGFKKAFIMSEILNKKY